MTDKDYVLRAIALSEASPELVGCGVVIVSDGKVVAETCSSQRPYAYTASLNFVPKIEQLIV